MVVGRMVLFQERVCLCTRNGPVFKKECVYAHEMVLVQVRVCLLSCAEEVCFKNVNTAQLENQD